MSYITPVTDRSAADIAALTSKAYFNVVDWERIHSNTRLVVGLLNITAPSSISLPNITSPTILSLPDVANFNWLLEIIEVARQEMNPPTESNPIKHDWMVDETVLAPNYTHVNQWERVIDVIWQMLDGVSYEVCPTLTADLVVPTGINHIVIDCLNLATFNLELQGTASLYIL